MGELPLFSSSSLKRLCPFHPPSQLWQYYDLSKIVTGSSCYPPKCLGLTLTSVRNSAAPPPLQLCLLDLIDFIPTQHLICSFHNFWLICFGSSICLMDILNGEGKGWKRGKREGEGRDGSGHKRKKQTVLKVCVAFPSIATSDS